MRVDVVLRYIGVVMLFIAGFMLLSAGISCLNGVDSAFYPLLLSALLTTLLGAFPLILWVNAIRLPTRRGSASSSVRGFCRVWSGCSPT